MLDEGSGDENDDESEEYLRVVKRSSFKVMRTRVLQMLDQKRRTEAVNFMTSKEAKAPKEASKR